MKSIYLAGSINIDVVKTLTWRQDARELLLEHFEVLDPLRGKENIYKGDDQLAINTSGMVSSYMSAASLMTRDYNDVMWSDVILVNLSDYGSDRPLVGTMYELAWAWKEHRPVMAFVPRNHWIRQHPFVSQSVSEWFEYLEDAVEYTITYYST